MRGDALVGRAHRGAADQLARIPRCDWRWGTATARQRLVHRLSVVSRPAEDRPELSGLGRPTARMCTGVVARWPALRPLPSRRP